MLEQITEGDWTNAGEFMDGNIAIIVGDPSQPAWEWEFVASVLYEADDEARGRCGITHEQAMANANVMAASKKLLAACESALNWYYSEAGDVLGQGDDDTTRVARQIQDAINDARGKAKQPEVVGFV